MGETLLKVEGLNVQYGAVHAVQDLSFEIERGEILAILGANAAGKTSTLSSISGLVTPASGKILYKGKDIMGIPSHKVTKLGIAHVPEGREIFPNLTVYENLEMGAFVKWSKEVIKRGAEQAYELFPVLAERRTQLAGTLSGGEQQMLAIGRGLMSEPDLLLLDEPSMGLAPKVVALIFEVVAKISTTGITIIMVEQNAKATLGISNRAVVIDRGKLVVEGKACDLINDPQIKAAYLGA